MAEAEGRSAQPHTLATRSSLACAPCRYKHLRCDGKKPACSRCKVDKKECSYHASRRRGNTRPKPTQESSTTTLSDSSSPPTFDSQGCFDLPPPLILTENNADLPPTTSETVLLGLYYESFHAAHPCVLPRRFLNAYSGESAIQPLLLVLNYIGSLFATSTSSSSLLQDIQKYLDSIRSRTRFITGFDVQAVLLYSSNRHLLVQ